MTAEMISSEMSVSEEHHIELYDGETWLGRLYFDHLVETKVIVECKAFIHMLTDEEVAQVITYLAASSLPVGLLFNFGRKRLEYKRILKPKDISGWQEHARRFAWRPPSEAPRESNEG
jgi:GxxExxY protein